MTLLVQHATVGRASPCDSVVATIRTLGPDNVNCRGTWPARKPVARSQPPPASAPRRRPRIPRDPLVAALRRSIDLALLC
jgi:hypothetical protein